MKASKQCFLSCFVFINLRLKVFCFVFINLRLKVIPKTYWSFWYDLWNDLWFILFGQHCPFQRYEYYLSTMELFKSAPRGYSAALWNPEHTRFNNFCRRWGRCKDHILGSWMSALVPWTRSFCETLAEHISTLLVGLKRETQSEAKPEMLIEKKHNLILFNTQHWFFFVRITAV